MSSDCIEFDFKFEDFNKILVIVKDVTDANLMNQKLQCDCYHENECHHLKKDHQMEPNLTKCNFCQFLTLLKKDHTEIKIKNETTNQSVSNLLVRYKTINYPEEFIEWTDYQNWRSPYALICFATCVNNSDLFNAIRNFEKLTQSYKKTLISSKLFIDYHLKHETDESYLSSINETKSFTRPTLVSSISMPVLRTHHSSLDTTNSSFDNDDNDFIIDTLLNSSQNLNSDLSRESNTNIPESESFSSFDSQISTYSELKEIDLLELESKRKKFKNDIIYLDFLFATNGVDKLKAIIETEKSKINSVLNQSFNLIYTKLSSLASLIDPSNDKQYSDYSDKLKTPIERKAADAMQSSTMFLSIKIFNKKQVIGRMAKYKADLYLSLNKLDSAFVFFTQAYNASKRENDSNWAFSALTGLCAVSYLILKENNKLNFKKSLTWSEVIASSEPKMGDFKSSLKKFKSQLSSKELNHPVIQLSDFTKNFTAIIDNLNKDESTKLFALETTFMISKLFLENNMRNEALNFINYSVYVSCTSISEVARIKRYLEISKLYELCEMKRLASFYKWISAGRVFRFFETFHQNDSHEAYYLSCIVKRCIMQIINVLSDVKILPQVAPSLQSRDQFIIDRGFPNAKKYLIFQLIKLLSFNKHHQEMIKLTRYLLNTMTKELTDEELNYYFNILETLTTNKSRTFMNKQFEYGAKFYKIPSLNSLTILSNELNGNQLNKIISEPTASIYIHRYDPLSSLKKKKTYNLPANQINNIEFNFTNTVSTDLKINFMNLILEANDLKIIYLELFTEKKERNFLIPSDVVEFKINLGFEHDQLGKYKIIGYDLSILNHQNNILFCDLIQNKPNETNRNLTTSRQNGIESSYDIEIIPKIPLLNQVNLVSNESILRLFNTGITSTPILNCSLGTLQYFEIKFEFNEQGLNDLEIIELKFQVINDQLLNNLNANLKLIKEEDSSYKLEVDTSNYSTVDLTDLACFFKIKYTNKLGNDENLCYYLQKQLTLKFNKVIDSSLVNLIDLDENEFKIELLVKNLTDKDIFLEYSNTKDEILNGNSEIKLQTNMLKFDLINSNSTFTNDKLDIRYSLNKINYSNINFERKKLCKVKNSIMYKNPFEIEFNLTSNLNSNESLYSLGIFIRNPLKAIKATNISFEIIDKLKIINGEKMFQIDSLNEYCIKEINFISETFPDQVTCCIRIDNLKWKFKLDLKTNQLSYLTV